jgi:hypothetical protein
MKAGVEDKKKVGVLAVLMLAAGYFFYDNVLSTPGGSSPPPAAPTAVAKRSADLDAGTTLPTTPEAPAKSTQPRPLSNRSSRNDEFHPVLRPRNRQGEPAANLENVDPTIHTELLAKVQDVKIEGGQRNLFQFGPAAPVELPKKEEPKIKVAKVYDYPRPYVPPPPPGPPPPPPPPPPPSFKYYGLATKRIDNKRTAFFLDGEEIILATEGMTVKSRWRVVRIGTDSVMLEDAQTKKQQPLALSEDAGGQGNS